MATFTTNTRLTKITTGDETGTWGTTTNTALDLIDTALGYISHANGDANETITIGDGAASDARAMFLKITGTLTADRTITLGPNTLKKLWFINNATSGDKNILISQGSGANVTIAPAATAIVAGDGAGSGAAMIDVLSTVSRLTVSGVTGLDVDPATDADADLITVGVSGTPRIWWDESDNRFTLTHGLDIDAGALNASGGGALTGTWSNMGAVTTIDINGGTIGGVTLDGTISGTPTWASTQAMTISGLAATATILATARTIGGTSFDGSANIAVALAATATILATGRNINGVSFNGSANITVTAAAGTLSGGTLASGVTASSLTSLGTIAALLATNSGLGVAISSSTFVNMAAGTTGKSTFRVPHGSAPTSPVNGDMWTTTSGLFLRANGSTQGPFSEAGAAAAGTLTGATLASGVTASSLTSVGTLGTLTVTATITGSVSGSSGSTTGLAATATALATARTIGGTSFDGTSNIAVALAATATILATGRNINGVSFNGSANITVTAAAGTLSGATLASGVTASSLTSLGTLAILNVDNIRINGNTISSTAGTDLLITPLAGQQIVLDGTIVIDAGVVTGATSITSTAFVGALTGNASGSAATVTGAAQTAITSLGTITSLVAGNISINDTGDANVTTGLVVNQGAGGDAIMSLKSSDVGHGLTSSEETDTYLSVRKTHASYGGALLTGLGEDTASLTTAFQINALGGRADATKSTSGDGLITLYASQHNGSNSFADVAADGNVFVIKAQKGSSATTVWIIDEDGDYHYDGADGSAFDDYDDASLVRAFAQATSKEVIRGKWDEFVRYNEADLVEAGILGDTVANGGLVNGAQLQRLHTGAIWQNSVRVMELEVLVADLSDQVRVLTA